MEKKYEYLFLCSRIKAQERNLLNNDRMERMLDARNNEEALDVLVECGYEELPEVTAQAIDQALAHQREAMMHDLFTLAPEPAVVSAFKIRYDYHNAKVLLKSDAMNVDPEPLLVDTGRVPLNELVRKFDSNDLRDLPPILQEAIVAARDALKTTRDPQKADFILDRAYYADMNQIASEVDSEFFAGYVRVSIDAANLRSVVRTLRMGKDVEFLKGVLFEGGNVELSRILGIITSGASLEELYATTVLRAAAEEATQILSGGPLTRFEKLCDDAVTEYLTGAKYEAFGEAPVVAYLAAKESEFTAIRIIMTGRMAGLDTDTIRERLREAYV